MSAVHRTRWSLIPAIFGFLWFVGGTVAGSVLTAGLDRILPIWQAVIYTFVLLSVALLTYVVSQFGQHLDDVKASVEVRVRYIDGPDSAGRAKIYQSMENEVKRAEKSIVTVSYWPGNRETAEEETRGEKQAYRHYNQAITERIKAGVLYERIIQISGTLDPAVLGISSNTAALYYDRLTLREQSGLSCAILVAELKVSSTFIMIDDRVIFLQINGISSDGVHRMVGMFIIEDNRGDFVEAFHELYRRVHRGEMTHLRARDVEGRARMSSGWRPHGREVPQGNRDNDST